MRTRRGFYQGGGLFFLIILYVLEGEFIAQREKDFIKAIKIYFWIGEQKKYPFKKKLTKKISSLISCFIVRTFGGKGETVKQRSVELDWLRELHLLFCGSHHGHHILSPFKVENSSHLFSNFKKKKFLSPKSVKKVCFFI